MTRSFPLLCFSLLLVCNTFAQNGKSTDTYYQTSEVQPVMVQYDADKGSLTRFYTVTNSPERRERLVKFNQDYLKQLAALDFDKMKVSGQVDYLLFKRQIDNELRVLDKEQKEYTAIYKYVSFGDPIYQLEKLRRRGTTMNSEDVAGKLTAMQQQFQAASVSLAKEGLMEMPLALRAEGTVRG